MKISIGLLLIGCNAAMGHKLHRHHHHKHRQDNMLLQIDTNSHMYNKLDTKSKLNIHSKLKTKMHTKIDTNATLDTHGIFDKAIAKIEKEENDKTDAINLLNELHEK